MSGNYTGPYWSDGKFQESVAFGERLPTDDLDALSRLHDTAYAVYKDNRHREAADLIYASEAAKLTGDKAALAGNVVKYGNYTARRGSDLAENVVAGARFGPLGALVGAGKFVYNGLKDSMARIDGTYLSQEKADVLSLYSKDPSASKRPVMVSAVNDANSIIRSQPVVHPPIRFESQHATRSPERVTPIEDDQARYFVLPTGNRIRRKKAKKRVVPELVDKPRHKLAALAEQQVYRAQTRLPPGAVVVQTGYDPTWNVNNLKMKRNKVLPGH